MKEIIRVLYQFKIRTMFYFQLGYSEVNSLVSLVKDMFILLGFAVIIFKIHLSAFVTMIICVVAFLIFVLIGIILKKSGMSDYAIKTSNSVNPELKLVRKIAKHLGIKDE